MTLGRTGLGARTTFHSLGRSAFTRDRTDGGGGGQDSGSNGPVDDAGDVTDDVDDTGTDDADDDDDDSGDDSTLGDAGKRALKAERDKVRDLRRQLRELRQQQSTRTDDKGDGSKDDAAARAAAIERARELAKPMIVRSEARSKLAEAGVIGDPARALRLLDLSEVDVTYNAKTGDVDEIDGLDDEIEKLTEDYPELFKTKRGGGGRIDGADRRTDTATKKKSASEIQAAGLRGGR